MRTGSIFSRPLKPIGGVLTVHPGVGLLERHAVLQSPSRIEELIKIFIHATKVRGTNPEPLYP